MPKQAERCTKIDKNRASFNLCCDDNFVALVSTVFEEVIRKTE